jgi:DNA-directed RNA polymerase subunit RPC12/RpoP
MVRMYWNNDSFPELREIRPQWARTVTWWRAIARALRDVGFWSFVLLQAVVALGWVTLAIAVGEGEIGSMPAVARWSCVGAGFVSFAYLQVSLGGDMMRSHLRAVSEIARYACPRCGQSLFAHFAAGQDVARCPECATEVERSIVEPPYRIPKRFRLFPFWVKRAIGR